MFYDRLFGSEWKATRKDVPKLKHMVEPLCLTICGTRRTPKIWGVNSMHFQAGFRCGLNVQLENMEDNIFGQGVRESPKALVNFSSVD